jgi:hypothetical protein
MDPAKRAQFEKFGVIGLSVVFLFVFLTGPAKSLGLFGSAQPAAPAVAQPAATATVVVEPGMTPAQAVAAQVRPAAGVAEAAQQPGLIGNPIYTAQALRNPFESQLPKPPAPVQPVNPLATATPVDPPKPVVEPPRLVVQGIIWGGPKPQAIINDLLYGIDDTVKGAKILSIDEEGVTAEFQGETVHYSLSSDIR